MKHLFLILTIACSLSCKNKNTTSTPTPTPAAIPPGIADVTVTSGSATTKLNGPCGWAAGVNSNFIGANDNALIKRILSINFNIPNLPSQTTTYKLVASSDNDGTTANIVSMSFTEISGNSNLLSWDSISTSGNVTLVVSGNKVTVNLAGITLKSQTNSGFFTNLNVGELAKPGVLSGTLIFYK